MALTLRLVKGDTLTFQEMDDNFIFLSSSKLVTDLTNIQAGSLTSPSQGTLGVGGVFNVDLGLQTGDSPTFANLTSTGNITVEGNLIVTGSTVIENITYVPTVTTIYNGTTGSLKTIDASSNDSAFFDYVIRTQDGENKRAGGAIIMWKVSAGTVEFTEYSTLDIGDTSQAIVSASIAGSTVDVTVHNNTGQIIDVKSLARLF